jgi:hypothetical protein
MTQTYDITNDAGKVRLLISDVGGEDGKSFLYQDNEIVAFLELAPEEDIRLAAAQALRAIAANEAQVSKRIKYLELTTDGPSVAGALEKLADKYEDEAEGDSEVDIAEMGRDAYGDDALGLA